MRLEHSHILKSLPILKCCWLHIYVLLKEIIQLFLEVYAERINNLTAGDFP